MYLCVGEWNECSCTGERPPPCDKFTFNQLDKQRAILFGGKQSKYKVAFNEVYILTAEEGKEMVTYLLSLLVCIMYFSPSILMDPSDHRLDSSGQLGEGCMLLLVL